jgi:hypothetical protein
VLSVVQADLIYYGDDLCCFPWEGNKRAFVPAVHRSGTAETPAEPREISARLTRERRASTPAAMTRINRHDLDAFLALVDPSADSAPSLQGGPDEPT